MASGSPAISTKYSRSRGNDDGESDDDKDYIIPKKKCTDISSCGDVFIYLRQNPKTFAASFTFTTSLTCVLALGLSYAVGFHPHTCFFVAGVAGIVSNLYGFCHFRVLLKLREQVDDYAVNNQKFSVENCQLQAEADKLSHVKDELKDVVSSIKQSVAMKSDSLKKFRQLNDNLELTGKQNLQILRDLNEMAIRMEDQWKEQLIMKERRILHLCFDRFEFEGEADGISKEQFTQFKLTLPIEYQMRLTRGGDWQSIAGSSGILQLNEFAEVLDKFANEVADVPIVQQRQSVMIKKRQSKLLRRTRNFTSKPHAREKGKQGNTIVKTLNSYF